MSRRTPETERPKEGGSENRGRIGSGPGDFFHDFLKGVVVARRDRRIFVSHNVLPLGKIEKAVSFIDNNGSGG
jgi:hypothetical protein